MKTAEEFKSLFFKNDENEDNISYYTFISPEDLYNSVLSDYKASLRKEIEKIRNGIGDGESIYQMSQLYIADTILNLIGE